MHIIKLVSENVKRLTAVSITPDGNLVTIGGKNGAGKSSVLDSIAYALGGKELAPPEPIRIGADEAKIVVDLGEFIVTRRFYREKFACSCTIEAGSLAQGAEHLPECNSRLLGETKSTLTITNKEGAKYPSPQAMLDKLLGKLTFDPLEFSRFDAKKQNEVLRQLTSLDFTMLNTARKEAYDRRSMINKTLAIAEAQLLKMPEYTSVPAEIISIEEVSTEIKRGQALQREAELRIHAVNTVADAINVMHLRRAAIVSSIRALREQLEKLEADQATLDEDIDGKQKEAEKLVAVADEAKKAVPNFEQLDKRLREIDEINTKVRANFAKEDHQEEVKRLKERADAETVIIENIDIKKADMLESAEFPVEGLGLTDDGVTFNMLPLEQAAANEQLRISVAIGLALNPKLKVLLIRNGNLLDEDSLQLVADMAKVHKSQVWMEFVTKTGEGMTVMLEDGHVR